MGTFITNDNKLLGEVINNFLPSSKSIDILVGYFFFSGFNILENGLDNKQVRILVGMDVDITAKKYIREIYSFEPQNKSNQDVKEDFYNTFVKVFNETDYFDNEESEKSFKIFLQKICEGSLEIRKTKDPCHAKMYIFNYSQQYSNNGETKGLVIMGSSNLSYQGLKGRTEINAKFYNENDVREANEIFENLWDKSVAIVDKDTLKEFEEKVIKNIWYDKMYSPYQMYIRVLAEYFDIEDKKRKIKTPQIINNNYQDFKYQTDAIHLALRSIENHNGVIISDVVGLGKSIIASAIAYNLDLYTIIICPPHLKDSWELYCREFNFNGHVFTSGSIDHAVDVMKNSKSKDEYLVIVDEAHRYRNDMTKDYSDLHQLCLGNKVILLTATPFNNNPNDIYSLLKLFQLPDHSTLKTVNNLGATFRNIINEYQTLNKEDRQGNLNKEDKEKNIQLLSKQIRSIIAPVCIRRSRLDLLNIPEYREDLKNQNIEIILSSDPVIMEFDLGKLSKLYISTLKKIDYDSENKSDNNGKYKAARYNPANYIKEESKGELKKYFEKELGLDFDFLLVRQRNISKFMRRLLVRRFESSVNAFKTSLESILSSNENILSWIEHRNKVPIYKQGDLPNLDEWETETDAELEEKLDSYREKGFYEIDMKYINEYFIKDIQEDIKILTNIKKQWFPKDKIQDDPKLKEFKNILKFKLQEDPDRKIIVFSEFTDTVNYLAKELMEENLPIMKFTSADAKPSIRQQIRENFDAGIPKENQKDDFKILIATDAISEGYNLHRAGAIFNYDIPYNPTRVIQRVGRINRINKKVFDKLYIYNYFPTDIGEQQTRTKAITTLKMKMIHLIMGEDAKVLTKDEELQNFFEQIYKTQFASSEQQSWDTKYRQFLSSVRDTKDYENAMQLPLRVRTAKISNDKNSQGVIVFGKKGDDFVFKYAKNSLHVPEDITPEDAFKLLECDPQTPIKPISKDFHPIYNNIKQDMFNSSINSIGNNDNKNAEIYKILNSKIRPSKVLSNDYITDLAMAVRQGGLSNYELKYIKKLKPSEYKSLPEAITSSYLSKIINKNNVKDNSEQVIIISEELIKK